ncbi:ATP-binding protein [Olsenella profusa]|uniref:Sensor-like histidine kinase SenX3 n=1 Tax=Olsenella profusa TaxID=138595 RepID=A0ABS2EZU9_9ACTN|nr:HAMP domain-containing histidine kinase [Olsenella profusa]
MLARLRRELIAITMALVGLVLAGVLGFSLLSNAATLHAQTAKVLQRALAGDIQNAELGDVTGEQGADVALTITLDLYWDGTTGMRSNHLLSVPDSTLSDVLVEVLSSSSDEGHSEDYPISWARSRHAWGWRVALVDTYTRDATLRAQAISDLVIFLVSMGALFVVAYLLSGWALRPVERAWEQQRRFVSDASHELKTPLAVILANTQILEADGGVPKEARRWVHSTSEEVTHMKGLVEDLLTLARADEQEASGTRSAGASQAVDLSALVSGCALEFDAVAFERGCSIECALADGVTVTGDPEQLRRVVRTLLDNATKYADRGTPVRVGLSREGRRARLTVNNRGETIAPEDLAHLFDRFYRTDDARERQSSGGFGLGLAIAKSLVESMGGKISARSTDANGTTFEVTL